MSNSRGKMTERIVPKGIDANSGYSAELVSSWLPCTIANTAANAISPMYSTRQLERNDWM